MSLRRWLETLDSDQEWDGEVVQVFGDWCEEQGLTPLAEALRGVAVFTPKLEEMLNGLRMCAGLPMTLILHDPVMTFTHETTFGRELRRARVSRSWSRAELADRVGDHLFQRVTTGRLAAWERGTSRPHRGPRDALVAVLPELANVERELFEDHAARSDEAAGRRARPPAPSTLAVSETRFTRDVNLTEIEVSQPFKHVTRTVWFVCVADELPAFRRWIANRRTVISCQLPVDEYLGLDKPWDRRDYRLTRAAFGHLRQLHPSQWYGSAPWSVLVAAMVVRGGPSRA